VIPGTCTTNWTLHILVEVNMEESKTLAYRHKECTLISSSDNGGKGGIKLFSFFLVVLEFKSEPCTC
jgi:hypothetical protein